MIHYKKLIGKKLYLSPMSMDDVEKYTEWLNNFDISIFLLTSTQIISPEGEKKFIEESIKNNSVVFDIVDMETDKLIGNCGLMDIDHINRKAGFGIFIGDKTYQNKGYGTEAIRLILDYAFNLLNLHNIWLFVYSFNKRAIKCYEKVGFKLAGRRRESKLVSGKYYDEIYMDILDSEFESPYIKQKMIEIEG